MATERTAQDYKAAGYKLRGKILAGLHQTFTQAFGLAEGARLADEVNGEMDRLAELYILAGMAEVAERASALVAHESHGVRTDAP